MAYLLVLTRLLVVMLRDQSYILTNDVVLNKDDLNDLSGTVRVIYSFFSFCIRFFFCTLVKVCIVVLIVFSVFVLFVQMEIIIIIIIIMGLQ